MRSEILQMDKSMSGSISGIIVYSNRMISTHLRKANTLLRAKKYQESLQEYDLSCRISQQQPRMNSISTSLKGYNHFCLMEYQPAEKCFTSALQYNPFDSTTLFRRATLYLKTKEYSKAALDISRLSEIEPQSMRIGVLIMEIKQKLGPTWNPQNQRDPFRIEEKEERGEEEEVQMDQEEALNFSNLKKIDRVSLREIKGGNKRSSQINFGEDEMIEYEQSESEQLGDSRLERYEDISREKIELQELELNSVQSDEPSVVKFVMSKNTKKPKKSILKCSIAYKLPEPSEIDTVKTVPPINVSRVRDIDGKKLQSSKFIRFSANIGGKSEILRPNPGSKPRKSCMKNASMIVNPNSRINHNELRVSSSNSRLSFGELKNLQGKIIFQKPNTKGDSSGDESDQYNIFGNKGEKQLNEQLLKIKSFVGSVDEEFSVMQGQKSMKPKKSILKPKNVSAVEKDKSQLQSNINKKKSVIFK